MTKLKERTLDFTLKKKKLFGSNNLETKQIELRGFNAKSVVDKYVMLQGGRLNASVMIHKATRAKEFEKVPGKKKQVG